MSTTPTNPSFAGACISYQPMQNDKGYSFHMSFSLGKRMVDTILAKYRPKTCQIRPSGKVCRPHRPTLRLPGHAFHINRCRMTRAIHSTCHSLSANEWSIRYWPNTGPKLVKSGHRARYVDHTDQPFVCRGMHFISTDAE